MNRKPSRADSTAVSDEAIDALDALASEHRIAILRALAEADEPASFSQLREEIGMRDTGQFNYHLSKLLGRFVRETAGGYELGHAGERVVLAAADLNAEHAELLADGDETPDSDDSGCPVCGDTDCDRLIHVHLASRSEPVDRTGL